MSNFETLYRSKLDEVISGDADFEDETELEDALLELHKAQSEVDHFKALKKRRAAYYDAAIGQSDQRATDIRRVVQEAMQRFGKKTLKFPGVGSASVRKVKGKWNIVDEDMIVGHLEQLGLTDGVVETVQKLNKKELNKVLDELETNNNTGDGVKREDETASVTVKFEEIVALKDDPEPTIPTKTVSSKPGLDDIEI